MAIQTVTSANVAEYVAERTAKGSKIASGEEQVAAADAAPPSTDGTPTPGHPVIKPGAAETVSTGPDPGNATPTARSAEKEKTPVQARIDELTRLRKEAEEFAEDEYGTRLRAEARIAELETQLKTLKPQPEAVKPVELKRPSPKDFITQEDYDQAMETYDKARDERVRQEAIEQGRREVREQAQNQLMEERVNQVKAEIPDFVEKIEAAAKRTTVVPPYIKAVFHEWDMGLHIAYELAKDAALEKRIFNLSPAKAMQELGKLANKLESQHGAVKDNPAPQAKTVIPETTRAPAPLQSVRSTGEGEIRVDLTKPMPFAEYKAAKLAAKRGRH